MVYIKLHQSPQLHLSYFFATLKFFSRPLIVLTIILVLKMLFLNLYVLAKFRILRAEAAMLHIPLYCYALETVRNLKLLGT